MIEMEMRLICACSLKLWSVIGRWDTFLRSLWERKMVSIGKARSISHFMITSLSITSYQLQKKSMIAKLNSGFRFAVRQSILTSLTKLSHMKRTTVTRCCSLSQDQNWCHASNTNWSQVVASKLWTRKLDACIWSKSSALKNSNWCTSVSWGKRLTLAKLSSRWMNTLRLWALNSSMTKNWRANLCRWRKNLWTSNNRSTIWFSIHSPRISSLKRQETHLSRILWTKTSKLLFTSPSTPMMLWLKVWMDFKEKRSTKNLTLSWGFSVVSTLGTPTLRHTKSTFAVVFSIRLWQIKRLKSLC